MNEAQSTFPINWPEVKFWLEMGGFSNFEPAHAFKGYRMRGPDGSWWADTGEHLRSMAQNFWKLYYGFDAIADSWRD